MCAKNSPTPLLLYTFPTFKESVLYVELIEYLSDGVVNDVSNSFWMVIEGGDGGQDNTSQISYFSEQFQMALVQGCFPDEKNKFSPLLKNDIGRTDDKVVVVRIGNAG